MFKQFPMLINMVIERLTDLHKTNIGYFIHCGLLIFMYKNKIISCNIMKNLSWIYFVLAEA